MNQIPLPQIDYTPYIVSAYALAIVILGGYSLWLFFQRIKYRRKLALLKRDEQEFS